jgi:DNA-binding LytR/AlgR family response regulator
MKVLLIEDEAAAAGRMRKMLVEIDPSIEIVADVATVAAAVEWFQNEPPPDVAFFDVRLADGESFEIFKRVEVDCPVIFTTAYDEHALRAFRVNALDYLLKPVKKEELRSAVERVKAMGVVRDHTSLAGGEIPEKPSTLIKRFLIRYGDHFKLVEPDQIAYIHSLSKNTFLRTHEGKDLPLEESLDRLEPQLDPEKFFRLNRQLLVNIHSIKELLAYSKSRVKVMLQPAYDDDAIVSSERSADFKRWLAGN